MSTSNVMKEILESKDGKVAQMAKTAGLSPGVMTGITTGGTVAFTGLTQRLTGTTITTITGMTNVKAGILRVAAFCNQINAKLLALGIFKSS
ncbi:MAG: hypothetical protein V2A79_14980 [Planctomycetota bacterium]